MKGGEKTTPRHYQSTGEFGPSEEETWSPASPEERGGGKLLEKRIGLQRREKGKRGRALSEMLFSQEEREGTTTEISHSEKKREKEEKKWQKAADEAQRKRMYYRGEYRTSAMEPRNRPPKEEERGARLIIIFGESAFAVRRKKRGSRRIWIRPFEGKRDTPSSGGNRIKKCSKTRAGRIKREDRP